MECKKCVLCFQDAETLKSWEVDWSLNCAQSLHKLLNLELVSISFFEVASYCAKCKEIIRDVDFMTRSISAFENRLSITRVKIAQMLVDNFSAWAGFDKDNAELPILKISPPSSPNVTDNLLEEDVNPYQPDTFDIMEPVSHKEDSCFGAAENNAGILEHGWLESETPSKNPVPKRNGLNNYSGTKRNLTEAKNDKFLCDFPNCLKKFRTSYHLDCHKPTHIGWRGFKCTYGSCEMAFTRQQDLVLHLKKFHDHLDRSKLLKRKPNVKERQRKKKIEATLNRVEVEVTLICDYPGCGLEFSTPYLLDCHKPTHIGWRAFTCPEKSCQKTFRWRPHLTRHVKISHGRQNRIRNKLSSKSNAELVEQDATQLTTIEFPVQTVSESTVNHSEITIRQYKITLNQPETARNSSETATNPSGITINQWETTINPSGSTINQAEIPVTQSVSTENDLALDSVKPNNRRSTRLLCKPKVLPSLVYNASDCDDNDLSDSDLSYAASTSDEEDEDTELEEGEEIHVSGNSDNAVKESSSTPIQHKQYPSLQEIRSKNRLKASTANAENLCKVANRNATLPKTQNPTPRETETRKVSAKTFSKVENRRTTEAEACAAAPLVQEVDLREANTEILENFSNVASVDEMEPEDEENFNTVANRIAAECYTKVEIVNKELYKLGTSDRKLLDWETLIGSTQIPEETLESTFSFLFKLKQIEVETNLNYNYKCAIGDCYRGFKTQDDWKHHLLLYHGEYEQIFECPFCTTNIFRTGVRLDSHIAKVHLGQIHPHFCPVPLCESRYPFKNQLQRHMTQQHPDYKCDEDGRQVHRKGNDKINSKGKPSRVVFCKEDGCTYRTPYPKYLDAHMIKKHSSDSNTPAYKCDTCGRGFNCVKTYKHHSRYAHKGQDERFKCTFCPKGRTFQTNPDLNTHIRWKHMEVAPKFSCKVCTRVYFAEEDCTTHENLHNKTKGWSCVLNCGTDAFDTREQLVKHVKSTHEQMKELVCHACGYKTTGPKAQTQMDTHMKSHSREKTYKCKFCDKTVRHFSELTYHVQMVHLDEPGVKKNYKCEECGEQFSVYLYFYRHRRNKHGSNPMPKFQRKKK